MVLLGGVGKPLYGLAVVLRDTVTVKITFAEPVLAFGQPPHGTLPKKIGGIGVVLPDPFPPIEAFPQSEPCGGHSLFGGLPKQLGGFPVISPDPQPVVIPFAQKIRGLGIVFRNFLPKLFDVILGEFSTTPFFHSDHLP